MRASSSGWLAAWLPDTFDPKKYMPYEVGLPVRTIVSTFPTIDTVVDNIKITQGLENIAKVMDRGTLIRSTSPDLGTSCTRGISITGTPATCRRSRGAARTSAGMCEGLGRGIR